MSIQPAQRLDTFEEIVAGVEIDPPCDHSDHGSGAYGHSGPAWALIERLRPCGCMHGPQFIFLCRGAWEFEGIPFRCGECNSYYSREQVWRFVALVRP